ncbi:MAG: ATP-binding protein [Clostridiales bacterium]|nr:ATP-binding protein [Clostridiales bacterium]
MFKRDLYLEKLKAFKDKSLIKVITGVRRCGKSFLLGLFEAHLLESGISASSIIRMNFESLAFEDVRDYRDLNAYIKSKMSPDGMNYILLDEVQQVTEWERAVNSLRLEKNTDIYLTGSNAWLLSSELSTLLSGRFVEIKMLPLSFAEYLDFNGRDGDLSALFNQYMETGGFPGVTELRGQKASIGPFLNGIYNTIIMKDVVQRGSVRDPALLDTLVRFMAGNIGNIISTKKVSDYLTSSGRKTTSDTIDNYIQMLENAFILYRARRYDLKGKLHLKTQEKYYFVDTGIRNDLIGIRNKDYGFVLENIVYFELLRRGYEVAIGKLGTLEVDFVAVKPDRTVYYQVAATMLSDEVLERELKPLRDIPDNYEKVVLSMDRTPVTDYNGIRNINLIDFLLSKE